MSVAATTITAALDASEQGIAVADVLLFPSTAPFTVRLDSEWLRVTSGAGTTSWTASRGYGGTTAASHGDGTAIFHVPETYASLSRVKRRLRGAADLETTDDDDILTDYIGAAQSHLVAWLGMYLGPTTATEILVDGRDALEDGRWLYVPFGIQALTSVETHDGTDWSTVTAGDIVGRPRAHEPRIDPNQPTTMLVLKEGTFPDGYEDVRITGTLGWPEPPQKLGEIADTMVVKMYQARQTGQRDYVGNDEEGNPIISRFLSGEDKRVLSTFRYQVSGPGIGLMDIAAIGSAISDLFAELDPPDGYVAIQKATSLRQSGVGKTPLVVTSWVSTRDLTYGFGRREGIADFTATLYFPKVAEEANDATLQAWHDVVIDTTLSQLQLDEWGTSNGVRGAYVRSVTPGEEQLGEPYYAALEVAIEVDFEHAISVAA